MKNKTLAIFGIGAYILSVLSSAENLEGASVAPVPLVATSGIATLIFIVLATIRLWKEARILAIALLSSAVTLFVFTIIQTLIEPSYGSSVIILMNLVKVINFVVFILVIVKLFRMGKITNEIK
jgi:hypothetical protein